MTVTWQPLPPALWPVRLHIFPDTHARRYCRETCWHLNLPLTSPGELGQASYGPRLSLAFDRSLHASQPLPPFHVSLPVFLLLPQVLPGQNYSWHQLPKTNTSRNTGKKMPWAQPQSEQDQAVRFLLPFLMCGSPTPTLMEPGLAF